MKVRYTILPILPLLVIALLATMNGRLLFAISPETADPIQIITAVDPDTANPGGIIPGQMLRLLLTVKNVTDVPYLNIRAHAYVPTLTNFNLEESDPRWVLVSTTSTSTNLSNNPSENGGRGQLAVCPDGAFAGTECMLSVGDLAGGEEVTLSYAIDIDPFLPPEFTSLSFTTDARWDQPVNVTVLPPTITILSPTPTSASPTPQPSPTPTATSLPISTPTATPDPLSMRAYLPLMLR